MIAALCGLFLMTFLGTQAAQAQDVAPSRYVQAGPAGADLLNVADEKGKVVLRASAATPLAVYGERAGWLKVEAPGGVRVWAFGKYLKETGQAGWLEFTGNAVNMRPLPRSQNSFPVGQAQSGDRVRLIKRQDSTKALAEDWVQIWSPPGTHCWVHSNSVKPLAAGSSGPALWSKAVTQALGQPPVSTGTAGATPGTGAEVKTADAGVSLARTSELIAMGQKEFEAAQKMSLPDYTKARAAYVQALESTDDASLRRSIQKELDRIDVETKMQSLEAELAIRRAELEKQRREAEKRLAEANLRKDPLWGRFKTRGWLESVKKSGDERIYRVRFSGDVEAEVICTSGRYDLGIFEGFEIGVEGHVRPAREKGELPRVDASRIVVISGRYNR